MGTVANIKINPVNVSWGAFDLGYLDGNVSFTQEEQTFVVTAHQKGLTALAELRQGVSAEITLTLKESHAGLYKELYSKTAGAAFTPDTTEVFGWGTSKQGANTISDAQKLVFHPVNAGDLLTDVAFWLAYPKLGAVTFSGEEVQTMEVTFTCYVDETKDERVNLFVFGDHTQASLTI